MNNVQNIYYSANTLFYNGAEKINYINTKLNLCSSALMTEYL